MNKLIIASCVAGCVVFSLPACSGRKAHAGDREFYSPVEYNDFIVDQQNAIIRQMVSLNNSYETGTEPEIRLRFDSLVNQSGESLLQIAQLSPYENDSSLQREALRFFTFYHSIFRNEYRHMVEIFLKGNEATDEDIRELNNIVNKIKTEEEQHNRSLSEKQLFFARKFAFDFQVN